MKFSEYPYSRPNIDEVKDLFETHIQAIERATSAQQALEHIRDVQTLQNQLDTATQLVYIRNSIDTRDAFYDEEVAFWDEHQPIISDWVSQYYKAVLASPYRADFEQVLPATFFKIAEASLKIFDTHIIPLLQKENKLTTEYNKLVAAAEIEYKGNTYNLSELDAFGESTDRNERQAALTLKYGYFATHLAEFDRIFDELVKVRHEKAVALGFNNYVELGYVMMNRFDYNRDDVEVYRQEILKHVVPMANDLFERQQSRLQLDALKYYDLGFEYPNGNATPVGTPDDIVSNGVKMYHELSSETGEFIDFMMTHELLDLVTKPGKQSGGYCTYIPNHQSPFIFSNFNGTSADIDVLTHEAGHAFQVYQSRWIQTPESLWPTYESCEIHSMSMEFIAWPWMELFFKEQTPKYKFSHLASSVKFLPYGVLVDHFQHEVYENPDMTPEQRRATWRKLEKMYTPWKDYDGNNLLENGGFWLRQGHIFSSPFYYIDYTLAQVCAFQFWKRTQVDQDETAWADYLEICRVGGTQSFLQIVETAHLKSPFGQGNLEDVMTTIRDYLNNVSEASLII